MMNEKYQNGIDICAAACGDEASCEVNAFQEIDVCVPITIDPFVTLGEAVVECIEDPCIVPVHCRTWNKNGTCKFTIAQKICVMVPVEFKASATSGPTSVICGDTSDEDCPTYVCNENEGNEHHHKPSYNFYIKGKEV